jgi:hypothetical protein
LNRVSLPNDLSDLQSHLFLAAERLGDFAQQFGLLFAARLERPNEDLLKMIAIICSRLSDANASDPTGSG